MSPVLIGMMSNFTDNVQGSCEQKERIKCRYINPFQNKPLLYPRKTDVFRGIWNQPVCSSICVSICVQNTTFCQSAGRGIKSHLVAAVVFTCLQS